MKTPAPNPLVYFALAALLLFGFNNPIHAQLEAEVQRPGVESETAIEQATLYVPTAFSPNADGINDEFKPLATGLNSYRLLVYTRFGEEIFRSDDLQTGWNGETENRSAMAAQYIWKVQYEDQSGIVRERVGTVRLFR